MSLPAGSIVHVVLVKLKPELLADVDSHTRFLDECEALKRRPGCAKYLVDAAWRKPVVESRAKGFDWGLWSVFRSAADLDSYRVDPDHESFVNDVLKPNIVDILAYDFEI